MLARILRRIEHINQAAALLSAAAILVAMFAVTADVISFKLANQPLHGVTELSELLLVIIIYLAVGFTQIHGRHVKVDVLSSRVSPTALKRTDVVASLVVIFVIVLLTWRTGVEAIHSIQIGEMVQGIIDFPIPPARVSIFAGFIMLTFYVVLDFVRRLLLPPPEQGKQEGGVWIP